MPSRWTYRRCLRVVRGVERLATTRRVLMTTRRARCPKCSPANRAATWPRPSLAPGRALGERSRCPIGWPALALAFTTRLMNRIPAWPRAFGGASLGRKFSSSKLPIYEVCPCRAKLVVIGTSIIQYFDGVSGAAAQRYSKCVPAHLMCRQTLGRAHVPRPFILLYTVLQI